MNKAGSAREVTTATYEVHLQSTPPAALLEKFGPGAVRRTSAQTVLMRRVQSQDELANLLERVLAMGLVLNEVHELRVSSSSSTRPSNHRSTRIVVRAYEVRVDGRLEPPLLRFLQWKHRHLPEHATLTFEGTPAEVHELLSACCRLGLGVEQVRRVDSGSTDS